MSSTGNGAPNGRTEKFEVALERFRENGAALLVTGTVPRKVTAALCRRLLGNIDHRRVLVLTGDAGPVADYLPEDDPHDASHLRVICSAPDAGSTSDGSDDSETTTYVTADLGEVGAAASKEIGELTASASDPHSSELRLCVDSITDLADAADRRSVTTFCHLLGHRVRREGGIGGFHLPVDHDARLARELEPLFDARVALDTSEGSTRYRWRLRDGPESEWTPLSEWSLGTYNP
jgi:hypothetical protein